MLTRQHISLITDGIQRRQKPDNKENVDELYNQKNKRKRLRCDSRTDDGNKLSGNCNGSPYDPADFVLEVYEKTDVPFIPFSTENGVFHQQYFVEKEGDSVWKFLSSRDSAATFLRKRSNQDFLEVKMKSKDEDMRSRSSNYAAESPATYHEIQAITEEQERDAKNILRMLDETVESGDIISCHKYIRSLENYNALYSRERGVCSPLNDRIVELKSDVEVAEYTYRSSRQSTY